MNTNLVPIATTAFALSSIAPAQWTQQSPATSPAPRIETQMAFDAGNNVTVLFGGADVSAFPPVAFSDTWTFDGLDWTQQSPATSPPARYFGTMAYDVARGRTVLYGGLSPTFFGANYLDDTWEWDGSTWTQINTPNSPGSYIGNPGVGEICMAYDLISRKTILFGGELFQGIVPAPDITFEYDGTDWTQITGGVQPPRRSQASLCSAPTLGGVLLFGGTNFNNPPGPGGEIVWNDTWAYSGLTSTWTQVIPNGPVPPARAGASLEFDPNTGLYVMHGGYISTMSGLTPLTDTWLFDGQARTWTEVTTGVGNPSPTRIRFESAEAPGGCQIVFGGSAAVFGPPNNETWIQGCFGQATNYSSGCIGTNGTPSLNATSRPALGASFDIAATNFATTASLGFIAIGSSDTNSSIGPLPASLQSFGLAAGCQLLTNVEDTRAVALSAGSGTFSVGIPNLASFVGLSAYLQGFSIDPGATGNFTVSNGVRADVGY